MLNRPGKRISGMLKVVVGIQIGGCFLYLTDEVSNTPQPLNIK